MNNTETYASIPWIIEHGGQEFMSHGVKNSGGTKIFSVSGHVEKPGNYEIQLGMSFRQLLAEAGGVWKNRKLKAVIPGGPSTPVVPASKIIDASIILLAGTTGVDGPPGITALSFLFFHTPPASASNCLNDIPS